MQQRKGHKDTEAGVSFPYASSNLSVALPISRKVFDPIFALNLSIEERKLNLAEEAAIDLKIVLLHQ